jgi:hypothetical protein
MGVIMKFEFDTKNKVAAGFLKKILEKLSEKEISQWLLENSGRELKSYHKGFPVVYEFDNGSKDHHLYDLYVVHYPKEKIQFISADSIWHVVNYICYQYSPQEIGMAIKHLILSYARFYKLEFIAETLGWRINEHLSASDDVIYVYENENYEWIPCTSEIALSESTFHEIEL